MNFEIIQVQIIFSVNTKYGTFNDVLYYLFNEYQELSLNDIEIEKQKRINNWIAYLDNSIQN